MIPAPVTPPPARTVLIGSERTAATLAAQLHLVGEPNPVGCLLLPVPGEGAASLHTPAGLRPPVLARPSTPANLEPFLREHGITRALVCLPGSAADLLGQVLGELERLGIEGVSLQPLDEALRRTPRPVAVAPPSLPREMDYAALIGREPRAIDRRAVAGMLTGRRVLVTGAGGSIGSEIVRQVADFRPSEIILMERAENALFEIDRKLRERYPEVARRALLHDVVDAERTLAHVKRVRPHVVFHAAAHKHVPLMEDHPAHAVDNNFFGTKAIADAALAAGAERFVLISSDKAVHPSSVMGATKRLAELYVQGLDRRETARRGARDGRSTRFSMVRFGNVLGSACSVLPIWASQLADGQAITVTDPRMTRFFMTIPEAASLVIQAAALSGEEGAGEARHAAEVFVLDMGEPVRIVDLAERFLRTHGRTPVTRNAGEAPAALPEHAAEIVFTGIRPGEKLHEELSYDTESLRPTRHPAITAMAPAAATALPSLELERMVGDLESVRRCDDRSEVLATIRRWVPELPAPAPVVQTTPTGQVPRAA